MPPFSPFSKPGNLVEISAVMNAGKDRCCSFVQPDCNPSGRKLQNPMPSMPWPGDGLSSDEYPLGSGSFTMSTMGTAAVVRKGTLEVGFDHKIVLT